jgi:hypothetical protein
MRYLLSLGLVENIGGKGAKFNFYFIPKCQNMPKASHWHDHEFEILDLTANSGLVGQNLNFAAWPDSSH